MASKKSIAQRYAKALLAVCKQADEALSYSLKLEQLSQNIRHHKELKGVLENPVFSFDEKWAVLKDITASLLFEETLRRFTHELLRAGRMSALAEVAEAVNSLALAQSGKASAKLVSASDLSEEDSARIQFHIEKALGKKIILNKEVKKDLMAGFVVEVEGRVFDASLESSLQKLKKTLIQAQA